MASVEYKHQRPKKKQARQTTRSPGRRQEQVTQQQVRQEQIAEQQAPKVNEIGVEPAKEQAVESPPAPPAAATAQTGIVAKRMVGPGDAVFLTGLLTAALVSGIILLLWLFGK